MLLGNFQKMLPGVTKQMGFAWPRKVLDEILVPKGVPGEEFECDLGDFSENAPRCCKTNGFCVAPQ